MRMKQPLRHGDVVIKPITRLPNSLSSEAILANKLVVAYGESTGHSHVLKCAEPIYYYRDGGKLYFELTDIGTLTHQEHKTITIEPGSFEIEIERERDPFLEEIKQVID